MDNCEFLLNKWVICTIISRRLPSYPDDCQKYYDKIIEECNKSEENDKKIDKIFKCSVFSAH
jgi:hypothetical protein